MTTGALFAARHEAGHITASFLLGRTILSASIEQNDGEWSGVVRERALAHAPAHLGNGTHAWHLDNIDEATVTLAGSLAQGETPGRNSSDLDQGMRLLRGITHSEREFRAAVEYVVARTSELVRHPHFVFIHCHLTEALLRDKFLSGADARRECERAQLRYTGGRLHAA